MTELNRSNNDPLYLESLSDGTRCLYFDAAQRPSLTDVEQLLIWIQCLRTEQVSQLVMLNADYLEAWALQKVQQWQQTEAGERWQVTWYLSDHPQAMKRSHPSLMNQIAGRSQRPEIVIAKEAAQALSDGSHRDRALWLVEQVSAYFGGDLDQEFIHIRAPEELSGWFTVEEAAAIAGLQAVTEEASESADFLPFF